MPTPAALRLACICAAAIGAVGLQLRIVVEPEHDAGIGLTLDEGQHAGDRQERG